MWLLFLRWHITAYSFDIFLMCLIQKERFFGCFFTATMLFPPANVLLWMLFFSDWIYNKYYWNKCVNVPVSCLENVKWYLFAAVWEKECERTKERETKKRMNCSPVAILLLYRSIPSLVVHAYLQIAHWVSCTRQMHFAALHFINYTMINC